MSDPDLSDLSDLVLKSGAIKHRGGLFMGDAWKMCVILSTYIDTIVFFDTLGPVYSDRRHYIHCQPYHVIKAWAYSFPDRRFRRLSSKLL